MRLQLKCLTWVLIGVGAAFAQTTGTIRGTLTDPSDASVAGARITATLQGTGTARTASSDERGDYVLPALPVGRYTVEVEADGFKKLVQKDIELSIGRVAVINGRLQLGEVTQEVTAEASAPLVETTSTQLGAVVNELAVTNLPLNARDTYQLLQLQPGVQSQQGYDLFAGSERAGVVSVNGGRGRSNNFNVNGGDGNDQFIAVPAIQPSPDTIEEFRVLTNTFDAEFGRNSGAVINVVTKGGTNNFHGNVFEFFRNRALNTREFFNQQKPDFKQNQFGGTLGGPIRRDSTFFFASFEGRRIRRGISSDVLTVPTATERTGDFSAGSPFAGTLTDSYLASVLNKRPGCADAISAAGGAPLAAGTPYATIFPGNKLPPACFDATAYDLLTNFVPLPNRGLNQLQTVPVSRDRGDQTTFRIDHKLSDHQQLNFYYFFEDSGLFKPFSRFQAAGANVPGFGSVYNERIQQYNLSHTWTIGPTTINESRFAYFREGQKAFNHPERTHLVQESCKTVPASQCFSDPNARVLGITPGLGKDREGIPFINVSGGFIIGNNSEGELPQVGNSFHWSDTLSKVAGTHAMKFGADVRRQRFDQTLYFNVNGNYGFTGGSSNNLGLMNANGNQNLFPDYLLGLPNSYTQGSAQTENVRSSSVYVFAQDSWKMKPTLTLNYGLRWELNTPIADISGHVQTFRPGQDTTVFPCQLPASSTLVPSFLTTDCGPGSAGAAVFPRGLVVPGDRNVPPSMTTTYYNAFAPRIGLAWSPAPKGWLRKLTGAPGTTSIRMGWGLFYNPVEQLVLEQFGAEPPFGGSSSFTNVLFNTPFVAQNGTINPNPFNGVLNPPRNKPLDWSRFRPILLYGQFQPNLRTQYSAQYHFTIQRELVKDLLFQIGYVGSQGHRLLATHDLNYGRAQPCLDLNSILGAGTCGPYGADNSYTIPANTIPTGVTLHLPYGSVPSVTGPNANPITLVGLRPYSSPFCEPTTGKGCPPDNVPVFSSIFAQDTIANSNYNSMQIDVEKRFSRGLQFQVAYTWSKSIDDASSFENILNPLDFRRSRSLSLFDARHRLVFSYYYQLPAFSLTGAADKLLNGWGLSGIVSFQSGFPIRITSSDDRELMNSSDFELPGEPDLIKPFRRLDPRGPGNRAFDPSSFAPQALGTIGSSPRSVCCGPGINNFDLSFLKETRLSEHKRLQFRAEFFNFLNHAQFSKADGNITDGADFGRVTRARDPRLIQFAMKLFF